MNFKAKITKTATTGHFKKLILLATSLFLFSDAVNIRVYAFGKTKHPYILWTSEEAAGLRKIYETKAYKSSPGQTDYDLIIIGSGLSGRSSGLMWLKNTESKKTLIIDFKVRSLYLSNQIQIQDLLN